MNHQSTSCIKYLLMRILKFGGKSLDTAEKRKKICQYIKYIYEKDKKIIVVVSAIGLTTDNLIDLSKSLDAENLSKRELDVLLSTGETISSSLIAMTLIKLGVPAKSLQAWQVGINTMGDFQNSLITSIDKHSIEDCFKECKVAVVTGFQGINKDRDITTLGRGGSDTTAAALGATFQTNVELYSDFNGVYVCDPNEIKSKKIKHISLNQLDIVSQTGSRVVCNRAVKIAKNNNIGLIFKSSSNPKQQGTITNTLENNNISICTNQNLCVISIIFEHDNKLKFTLKNVFLWLEDIKLYNLTSNLHNITLLINQADKEKVLNILKDKLNL